MNTVEIIGIVASILIVLSMVFKTTDYKGTIAMRVINAAGSIFFVIYGVLLPAWSTMATNAALFCLNIFYLIKEIKDHNKMRG